MYQAEIEVAKQQSKLIHHERQSYTKTEKCRLLPSTTSVVALCAPFAAAGQATTTRWTPRSGQANDFEWHLVRVVDRLSMESGQTRVVRGVQQYLTPTLSGVAAKGCV